MVYVCVCLRSASSEHFLFCLGVSGWVPPHGKEARLPLMLMASGA
jgi:hypothetical protein